MKPVSRRTLSLVVVSSLIACMIIPACNKNSNNYNPGNSTSSLWPLKAGNTWIYKDSVFSDSALQSTYPDTITLTSKTYADPSSGLLFSELYNPNGWFGTGSYVSVTPDNSTIYEMDSSTNSPYIFFGTTYGDGVQIGTGADYSNPACPNYFTQYGFISTTSINGYTCLKNIEYTTNCSNVNTEAVVYYVSPGVGVVRMEDYIADSTHNNTLYLNFSQTLQSVKLN